MSLVFNNTSTSSGTNGIIQVLEKNCGFNRGDISGSTERMQNFTSDINLALDDVWGFMFPLGGTWQLDDSNFTDYPIITTNIVSGQRDYSFTTDGSGNTILDIYKVVIKKSSSGDYEEIYPVDQQSEANMSDFFGSSTQPSGIPMRYDKTGNAIFFDVIPNYNATDGLKVYINREASYFTVSDTTKKPGFVGLFHEYLALRPAYQYAYRNNLSNTASLEKEMLRMQMAIKNYYGSREKDVVNRMTPNIENTR